MCSGYGGLELGVTAVFGGEVMWHCEVDADASAVLAARWPGVPNLGDLTEVEWRSAPPVDVLCAGFPCQPASTAGKRKGMSDDRWLWPAIVAAVGDMATPPRWVVLENVRGLLTVDGGAAFGRVVHDLAHLGYVGAYRVVAACDVGACHRRERVFVLAAHADGARLSRLEVGHVDGSRHDADGRDVDARWAGYAAAVGRWAGVVGRAAPWPALTGKQVNARLVEWMMGLPDGWVTDVLPNRRALRVLGNGVVPQQAAAAVASLVGVL